MKKYLLLLVFIFVAGHSFGQITFTLVSAPCDSTKVLAVTWPPGTGPYSVEWRGAVSMMGSLYQSHAVPANYDTLFNYTGGKIHVQIVDSSTFSYDTASYVGSLPLTFTFDPIAPFCGPAGAASITVTGGVSPYSYYWYSVSAPSTIVSTTNPAMLTPYSTYGVEVIDAAGCMTSSNAQAIQYFSSYFGAYTNTVSPTPTFSTSSVTTPAGCTNGTASINVTGGAMSPLSYSWASGATTASLAGLTAGSYPYTVTDAAGCVANGVANVTQAITIGVNTTPTPATCLASDGALIAFGSGGATPYTYMWSNGVGTQAQSGLVAGTYGVTVTDANGCKGTGSAIITASTPITVTYSTTPSLCTAPTGSATLNITGGTAPYTDTFLTSPIQTGITATTLAPGTYGFRIRDAVGCLRTGSVIVPPISNININITTVAALCTLATGSANSTVSGGIAPYTYSWSTGATTPGISSKPTGTYHLTVTDGNSCSATRSAYIAATSPVTVGVSTTPASCIFNADGTATAVGFGGTSPYTYNWLGAGTTSTVSGLSTGWRRVYVSDAIGCTAQKDAYVSYNVTDSSCFCIIRGRVYYDMNGNCVQDAGEPGINNIQIQCTSIGYTYTNAAGDYYFIVPAGTYTIKETVLAMYPLSACQSNNITVTAGSGPGCAQVVDFANAMNPIHDVSVSAWDFNFPVPGNNYQQKMIVTNHGTVTEPAILGGYKNDGQLFAATFTPSGVYSAGSPNWYNTITGSGLALAPGTSATFFVDYNVPTFIPMGTGLVFNDTVAYAAPVSNWLLDYSPWNNVNYRNSTVVASYDPNFVEVAPQGIGTPGNITYSDSTLTYMVHFQNTGTYKAQNIYVLDTLDPNLDWATMRPVYASANCKVTLGNNGVLKYNFPNIDLPPKSTHPVASNGMYVFTIKTKPGMPLGTTFKKKVAIYFDYNAPVITNQTLNTLWAPPTNVNAVSASQHFFDVYPNPASHTFNTVINGLEAKDAQMTISDVTGKTMMSRSIDIQQGRQVFTTDISGFGSGVYFVTINSHGTTQTQKLMIMK